MEAGVLMDYAERSAMLLSDPTENGWRARSDKSIEDFLSRCMADISEK